LVELVVLDLLYWDVIGLVLDYIGYLCSIGFCDVVVVFIFEYVVGYWWEYLLYN